MEVILSRSTRFVTILGLNPMFMTKHFLETVRFIQCTDTRRWKFKLTEKYPRYENYNYVPFFNNIVSRELPPRYNNYNGILMARYCDSKQPRKEHSEQTDSPKKMSLFAKMKQMTKDYWHILVPVHIITSLGWTAIFYLTIKNGVDIGKLMELMNFSDKYLNMVRNSDAGTWALTYALYKIFTPLRYTVTIGLTTMAIKHLSKSGYVKPLPFGKQAQAIPKPAYNILCDRIK
ncbi:protein FAM210A-like isoform X2 [Ptiloglossa arizonensis]|uniref:protein FAM210A-like isoform X2 n=1 Tax=Ptiloglossa arizonensis TaxID=3350558 RepID=UPI003F9EDDFB